MVKPGAVVVGAGVSFEGASCCPTWPSEVAEVAAWLSPRIGGVGPMTRAMLMANTVEAAERAAGLDPAEPARTIGRRSHRATCRSLVRHDADPRPARRRADALVRVLPAQDRRGRGARSRTPIGELEPLRAVVRLGHLRRRRLHPGPHPRHRHRHQPADAGIHGDGPPHLHRPHPRPARTTCSTTTAKPASRTCSPWPATRRPTARRPAATSVRHRAGRADPRGRRLLDRRRRPPRAAPPVAATAPPTAGTWPPSSSAADFGITQFFFEAEPYVRMVDELDGARLHQAGPRRASCRSPTPARCSAWPRMAGSRVPAELAERFEAVADDPDAVRALGVEVATELCAQLLDQGAPGLHFYTLNRSASTKRDLRQARPLRRLTRPRRIADKSDTGLGSRPMADKITAPLTAPSTSPTSPSSPSSRATAPGVDIWPAAKLVLDAAAAKHGKNDRLEGSPRRREGLQRDRRLAARRPPSTPSAST